LPKFLSKSVHAHDCFCLSFCPSFCPRVSMHTIVFVQVFCLRVSMHTIVFVQETNR
jgi:hypothetical protein